MHNAKPFWTLLLPLLPLTAILLGEAENRLWMSLPAALIYSAMQWLLPKCRLRSENYFSPVNIALFLFALKLIVAPVLIICLGPQSTVLSSLPSMASMEASLAIDIFAYVALCLGLSFTPNNKGAAINFPTPSLALTVLFAGLGLVGLVAEFRSPARLLQYFTEPSIVSEMKLELDGTLTGLIGTFLKPFFAFALIAAWSRVADSSPSKWQIGVAALFTCIGVTVANMTYSFNRAAFVFPLLCLAAVFHNRIRRIPLFASASVAMIALPVLIMISSYRSDLMAGKAAQTESPWLAALHSIADNVQGYAVGPQFTGLFYDRLAWGERLYSGSTLVSSLLSPVPVLGKNFRENSGPTLFNQALYGITGIEDQILPFAAELFANFHLPGVLAGFLVLGSVLVKFEQWIGQTTSIFAAFSLQYTGLWTAMLCAWSLSIYSQIAVYFFGPIYCYLFLTSARDFLRRPGIYQAPFPGVAQ